MKLKFHRVLGLFLSVLMSGCTNSPPASPTAQTEPQETVAATAIPTEQAPPLRAGLRSSSYGISPFPSPEWWLNSTTSMAAPFEDAVPSVVWIVGIVDGTTCRLNFPTETDEDYPNIITSNYWDANEAYLDAFDKAGIRVWLQVEPAGADVSTLIDLTLEHYASHPSVVGFGVDVEWYKQEEYSEGKTVTDAEAQAWSEQVRSYNSEYRLFLKHWLPEKMPPTYREGTMFLDDSQMFDSLDGMVAEFVAWGEYFAPAPVGFQYGYPRDRNWWEQLATPPSDIGKRLAEEIPNLADLYWVDFTAEEIWPQE